MHQIIFQESQRFKQKWLWAVMIFSALLIVGVFIAGIIVQIGYGKPFGNNPMSDNELIIWTVVALVFDGLLLGVFAWSHLETQVRTDGLYYRFIPFIFSFKRIGISEIKHYDIRKYNPIGEYGGWGIRSGSKKRGKAYNVSGDIGLQLELNNGKKILIGTHQPEKLLEAMNKIINVNFL